MASICQNTVTALYAETGRIQKQFEQMLDDADDYMIRSTRPGKYDFSMGENSVSVRYSFGTNERSDYQKFLPNGDVSHNYTTPDCAGNDVTKAGIKNMNASCDIPATRLTHGYQLFSRCPKRKAIESDIFCPESIVQKGNPGQFLTSLRGEIKRQLMHGFGESLEDDVVALSYFKTSMTARFCTSKNVDYFPAIPEGGLSIGTLQHLIYRMENYGLYDGLGTAKVNGRRLIPVATSEQAWEFMIQNDKADRGLELHSSVTVNDGEFGGGNAYRGFLPVFRQQPPRGWLKQVGVDAYEFVRVRPTVMDELGDGGLIKRDNDAYHSCEFVCDGERHQIYEMGFIMNPRGFERQSYASPQFFKGETKDLSRLYSAEVEVLNDVTLYDGCVPVSNEDRNKFKMKARHAYAPFSDIPELITAFLYKVSPDVIKMHDPECNGPSSDPTEQITTEKLGELDACNDCGTTHAESPLSTACDNIDPTDGPGFVRVAKCAYQLDEDATATAVNISVERLGGSVGAATVDYDVELPAGNNIATGTLNWTDEEFGSKTFTIDISGNVIGDIGSIVLSNETVVTLAATDEGCATAVVEVVDPNA